MQPVFCSQAHEGSNPGMWFYLGVAQQSREVPVTCSPIRSRLALESAACEV